MKAKKKNKNLHEEYFNMIGPYLSDMINDHKTEGEWKIQLSMTNNVVRSKDSDQIHIMHTKIYNVEIGMGDETDDIIKELFKPLLKKYREGLEESMRGSEFIFDCVDLLEYKLNKLYMNKKGGSYIDCPKWLKNKKATINPKNNDGKCFQFALTVPLNYKTLKETIKGHQKLSLL